MVTARPRSIVLGNIDLGQAQRVADAFLAAPRSSNDQRVCTAYADLARQVDRWFARLTGCRAARPVRVAYTRCSEPYPSAAELSDRVRGERVLELRSVHHDRDRRHPLLDNSVGGTYDRLRAVHDLVSHARCGFGFDRHGEFSAWLVEDRLYTGLARHALATELHAEHSVLWTTGAVAEHKAMLLDPRLVRSSRERGRRVSGG
jgi:hypothetical protein